MKKNGFAPLLIILIIAILGVVGYFVYKNYYIKFPKLAYTYSKNIADLDDHNPNFGVIYTMNVDGSNKKQLYKFDRNDLYPIGGQIEYIPQTNEIIINTGSGIKVISLKDSQIRTLYSGSVYNYMLSPNRQWIEFDKANNPDDPQYVQLNLKTLEISGIDDCHDNVSQFIDPISNSLVTVNGKDVSTGGAGTRWNTSEVTLCNLENHTKTSFLYPKAGFPNLQFIANNYLYFVVEQCCASTSSLTTLQQMDLRNGKIEDPVTIPEIYKLVKGEDFVQYIGLVGDHFFYHVSGKNHDFIYLYDYRLSTGKNMLISKLPYSQDNWSIGVINVSSDGNLLLFGRTNENIMYIYNFKTKETTQLNNLGDDGTYTILQ